jgi:hypothetical protein
MPAIDDEMGTRDNYERIWILCQEKKWQGVRQAMYEGRQRAFRFFRRHPFALQYVVADCVGN